MKQPDDRCGHKAGCTHREGAHVPKRGGIPAHCSKCKGGKAPHKFTPREAVTA